MKKVVAIVLVLALMFSVSAFAADVTDGGGQQSSDNVISANVISYFVGFFNIAYERKLMDYVSARVRAFNWALISATSEGAGNFWGLGADIYFYPQGEACQGWFVGPRFDTIWMDVKDEVLGTEGSWNTIMLGGQAGYKFVFDGGFALGISLGGWTNIANSYTVKAGGETLNDDAGVLSGFLPTFDVDLGFAF